jgi:hypothetical protein
MKKQQKIKEWRFQGGQPCTAISVFDVILDPLFVSVDDDFGEHLGMVAVFDRPRDRHSQSLRLKK